MSLNSLHLWLCVDIDKLSSSHISAADSDQNLPTLLNPDMDALLTKLVNTLGLTEE